MEETSDRANEAAAPTVGARLRAAREARGQSLDDIGRQTRVPVRHLVQIEEGRLEGLPAAPYSAGFVKSYAKAVDLDPVALSHEFRDEFDRANRASPRIAYEPYEPADPNRLPPRLLAFVALAIAILLIGGYALVRSGILTGESRDARAQLAANGGVDNETTAAPVAGAPNPVSPAAVAGGAVRLTAAQPVWFEITDRATGTRLFTGVLDQGKSFDVPATAADPVIRTGKPEGLSVTVGGQPIAPLGEPAHTIRDVSLKPGALLARGAGAAAPPSAPGAAAPPPAASDTAAPPAFRAAADGNAAGQP